MISTYNSYLPSIFGKNAFCAIFKIFGRAIFEVIEAKGGRLVKERDFEAEKNKNKCKEMKNSTLFSCVIQGHPGQSGIK